MYTRAMSAERPEYLTLTSLFPVKRFLTSMEFLSNFEEMCGKVESVRRLRSHPSYMVFISKFNLPVYFQMRSV
jgi:hypothetical protein